VNDNWWRESGHLLRPGDLKEILKEPPETIIIGSGTYSAMKVPGELIEYLQAKGIKLIVQPTPRACRTFNKLRKKRNIVAALHLSC